MAAIRTTDVYNVELTILMHRPLSRKEEVTIYVPTSYEESNFRMGIKDVRVTQVKMLRMTELLSYLFQETTMDHSIEARLENRVLKLLEIDNQGAGKGE